MKRLFLGCLVAAPLLAQTRLAWRNLQLFHVERTLFRFDYGRQVTTAGTFTNAFQANGSASFDGLNKVTLAR